MFKAKDTQWGSVFAEQFGATVSEGFKNPFYEIWHQIPKFNTNENLP